MVPKRLPIQILTREADLLSLFDFALQALASSSFPAKYNDGRLSKWALIRSRREQVRSSFTAFLEAIHTCSALRRPMEALNFVSGERYSRLSNPEVPRGVDRSPRDVCQLQ
jgi:hypothetical protein